MTTHGSRTLHIAAAALAACGPLAPALADPPATAPKTRPTTVPTTAPAGTSLTRPQVTVSDAGTVELHVNDADLLEVLRLLSLQTRRNIVAASDVGGHVTANLYNVTLAQALDAILRSNGDVFREQGNFVYVYTAKGAAEIDRAARRQATEVFRLYYTPAADAAAMIKPALSPDAVVAVTAPAPTGIDQSITVAGGNSRAAADLLVVTDYAENLARVRAVLREVDARPVQVLVEATILSASLSDNNALGVDFSAMGGIRFDQLLASPASTIAGAAAGALTSPAGTGVSGYGIGQTSFTNQLPAGGLRVGVLTHDISAFVQALESVTNTTVLANPKVLSLDKQRGYVHIGRSDGYQTTTVTQTTSTQTVQFLDTGTTLVFRPFVGDDDNIRMEIHPEDSSGGLNPSNLPFKSTTEVTTNMMVKDGHTIVIGGLFRDSATTNRGQVPLLGDIPILGALFRQQQDQTSRQEIIVLLTPHILKDDAVNDRLARQVLGRAEDLRVGVRRGMMFFGRERLAESAYDRAQAELDKPRPDLNAALWNLDAATNLDPTLTDAVELRQKVSGRRLADVDNDVIRNFVARSIRSDVARPPSPATQPTP